MLATVINVISFDLFFVAPRGTLAVSDVQYLLTFGVMLTVGLLIGNLTAGVRYQARVARYRERRTRHLYEMSKALAVGRSQQDIATTSERFIASTFQARSQLLLPDARKTAALNPPAGLTRGMMPSPAGALIRANLPAPAPIPCPACRIRSCP